MMSAGLLRTQRHPGGGHQFPPKDNRTLEQVPTEPSEKEGGDRSEPFDRFPRPVERVAEPVAVLQGSSFAMRDLVQRGGVLEERRESAVYGDLRVVFEREARRDQELTRWYPFDHFVPEERARAHVARAPCSWRHAVTSRTTGSRPTPSCRDQPRCPQSARVLVRAQPRAVGPAAGIDGSGVRSASRALEGERRAGAGATRHRAPSGSEPASDRSREAGPSPGTLVRRDGPGGRRGWSRL